MRYAYAKMTFHMMFISFLAFLLVGCGESGTPGGSSGPGVTASISLSADADTLSADGKSSTAITAVLTDSVGSPVYEQTSVVFNTNLGTFRNRSKVYRTKTADATGIVVAQLTTEEIPGNAEVWVQANNIKQKVEIKFFDPHKVGTISLRTGSASITADGSSQVSIIATVNDALGNPEEGATVNFKTTLGQFDGVNPFDPNFLNRNTTAITDVDGEARVMLVSGTTIGTANLLASLNGLNASASVVFTAGEPSTISLRAAPSTIRPNGTSTLFAKLKDINGNPVEGQTIVFSEIINASEGQLSPLSAATNVNGEAQVTYTAGKNPGADIIQAAMSSDLGMKATTTIVVDPGAIVINGITVTAGSGSLVADGKSKVKIRATVTDIDGNPAIGKTVNFTTTAGTLSSASAVTSDIGLAEVMLQATTISGPVTVEGECDGFIAQVSVELIPGPADHILMYALPNIVPPNGDFVTSAIIMDKYNNRIDDQRLLFQVRLVGSTEVINSAELTPDQAEDGIFTTTWTATNALYGLNDIEITAIVNNGVKKAVVVQIDENAIIVGSISVIAGATAIEADGKSSVAVRATVLDYNGQPAKDIMVDFSTTLGTLSSAQVKTDQNGFAEVVLKAGTVWGTATVTADANGFKGQVKVLFTTGKAGGLFVTSMPSSVKPGGQSTIIAELRSTGGEPVAGELLYFNLYENRTNGSISAIQATTDINGRATVNYTAGIEAVTCAGGGVCDSSDCIQVTLASDSSINATTCIRIATGIVGYMTLTSAENSLPADGISSTAVTAVVYDTSGVPMPKNTAITFTTTAGTFPGGVDPDGLGPITSQRSFLTADESGTVITSLIAGTVGGIAQIKAVSGSVSQLLNIIINDGTISVGSIVLTANPTSLPADGASSSAITAVVRDTSGNPVPFGTPVTFNVTPALIGSFPNTFASIVINTPDDSGTVTTSLIAGSSDGVAFVTATAGSVSQAIEVPILEELTGGLIVTASPTTLVADGASTSLIRATLTDSDGNPMTGIDVTFATSLGSIIGGPTVTTNASGIADVTLQSTTTAGTATVTATANGITSTVNVTFTSGSPGSLILAAAPSTVNPGGGACSTSCCDSTSTLTATLLDAEGNPMSGQTITFIITSNQSGANLSGPSAVTNINGQATVTYTAGNTNGLDRVTARSVANTIISDYVDITVSSSAAVVGSVTMTSGAASIVANGTSTTAIRATVLNACGNPMSGVTVNFATTLGALSAASAPTNASGIAEVALTSATNTGTAKVTAEASGFLASVNVAFVAGAPNSLTVNAAPSTVNPKGTSTVTATLVDLNGSPLSGETITFNLTINSTGASLSGPSAVTNILGQATITYTAGSGTGTDRIRATSVTNAAISGIVNILVDASATVVSGVTVTSGASSIVANGTSATAIRAKVVDTGGAPMSGFTVNFDTTLGTLSAASAVTNASGIAQVTLTSAVNTGTAKVTANAGGFLGSVNVAFVAGAPNSLTVNAAPLTVNPAGASTVTATLRDVNGNPLSGETITFALTINVSGASLSAPSAVTNILGQATITYTAGSVNGTDRIRATSVTNAAISGVVNIVVDASATVVGGVTVTSGASSIVANGTSATAIRAKVLDTDGAPMPGFTVNFDTTLGSLSAASAFTDASGIAQVTLTSAVNTGTAKVTANASGFLASVNVAFVAGAPNAIVVKAAPLIVNPAGVSTVTATLRDVNGNPLSGETITFALTINASGASLSAPSAVTNILGQATITYTAGSVNGTDRIRATSVTNAAISGVVNIVVDASATVVGSVVLTASPTSIPADGSSSSVVTAIVKDTNNDPMPAGTPVTFTTTSGTFPGGVDPDGAGPLTSQVTINITGATGTVVTSLISSVVSGTASVTATSSGVSQTVSVAMTGGGLVVSQIDVIIENTTLDADGVSTTNVYAYAKTALNQAVPNVSITFETSHGTITTPNVTDASGKATAVLTSSRENIDPVTVTARYNLVSGSATMKFAGVTLTLAAVPTSQVLGFDSAITATLKDAVNKPIAGATVSFSTSNPGAVVVPITATTNASGVATVVLQNSTITGDVTVTGVSNGATGTVIVNFGDYQMSFVSRVPEIINVSGGASLITVRLRQYGAACPGGVFPATVYFTTTLGTITPSFTTIACVSAAGYIYADATATLTAGAQGGTATINAYVDISGTRYEATSSVSIISPTANKIILEADPSVISVNTGISSIRARVLDSADNPVANKIIYFRVLQGPGGSEYLTPGFATTDADGRCVVYFHAGSISSDNIGDVIIQASDSQTFALPFAVGACNLTIAGQVHHVSVGVNLQSLPAPALTQGHLQVGVSGIAVDINGNPVADGTLVTFSVTSIEFDEDRADDGIIDYWDAPGQLPGDLIPGPVGTIGIDYWSDDINQNGILDFAGTEDVNNNGILDLDEDLNGNGVMDPPQGNLIVSPVATTDGVATTDLIYPMQYAANIRVRITASAGGKSNFYDYYLLCTTQMVVQGTCGLGY